MINSKQEKVRWEEPRAQQGKVKDGTYKKPDIAEQKDLEKQADNTQEINLILK